MKKRWILTAITVACLVQWAGCSDEPSSEGAGGPDKSELFSGKADESVSCEQIGLEPGCDACVEFGWYGDGECDEVAISLGLCAGPDPDCDGGEPVGGNGTGCGDDCGEMVDVPGGPFWMGCNEEVDTECIDSADKPGHEVTITGFKIDKYDVTTAQYRKCVDAGACTAARTTVPEEPHTSTTETMCNWDVEGRDDHPINCVDWSQAVAYCTWAGKRLPTEAEWERAARGVDGRKFPWGNAAVDCNLANYFPAGNACVGSTSPVGSNPDGVSPYSALDMAGNVWQWVADWYDSDYYDDAPTDNPTGPETGKWRVLRGGSWVTVGMGLRCSKRGHLAPEKWDDFTGFRCAGDQ